MPPLLLDNGDRTAISPPVLSTGTWGAKPVPTRLDRFHAMNPTVLDRIPLPHRDAIPRNGTHFTWADDALNLRMRAEEEAYVIGPRNPRADAPNRCKGWNFTLLRPCRMRAVKNVEGTYLDFCLQHSAGTQDEDGLTNSGVRRWAQGVALTARAIVAGASKRTRHGAYSEILKEKMRLILEAQDLQDEKTRERLEREADSEDETRAKKAQQALQRHAAVQKQVGDMRFLSDVMDAVDTDDLVAGLNDSLRMMLGRLALLHVMEAEGRLNMAEVLQGSVVLVGEIRKTAATKFAIVGSSSDELDRAVDSALDEYGLGGNNGRAELLGSDDLDDRREGTGDYPRELQAADLDL